MRGAVAAGHPLTAEAGARILGEGGNAVDACVAAAFASWVAESPLTGPGAGGFMLVHRARDRSDRLLDFFVAAPRSRAGAAGRAEMEAIDIDFDRESTQVFRIGAASCAVPGAAAGLEAAHRGVRHAAVAPADRAGAGARPRRGRADHVPQAYLHAILDLILRHTDEGRRDLRPPLASRCRRHAGSRRSRHDSGGAGAQGRRRRSTVASLGRQIVGHQRAAGGAITAADLAAYRVVRRRAVRARFRGHEFVSNPPPSSGGVLIAIRAAPA